MGVGVGVGVGVGSVGVVGVGVGVGVGVPVPGANARISASPTLRVVWLTAVTVNFTQLTWRDENVTRVNAPPLSSVGTATLLPSENVSVPAVTWSSALGRSDRSTAPSVTGLDHASWSHEPVPPPRVAHSAVGASG